MQKIPNKILINSVQQHLKRLYNKTAWYWHKTDPQTNESRIRGQERNACSYSHPIFDKSAKNIHRKSLCNWETTYQHVED
jgi:hypothetical protein